MLQAGAGISRDPPTRFRGYVNCSNSLFACCKSAVAKPSVKRPQIGPSSSRASARRF